MKDIRLQPRIFDEDTDIIGELLHFSEDFEKSKASSFETFKRFHISEVETKKSVVWPFKFRLAHASSFFVYILAFLVISGAGAVIAERTLPSDSWLRPSNVIDEAFRRFQEDRGIKGSDFFIESTDVADTPDIEAYKNRRLPEEVISNVTQDGLTLEDNLRVYPLKECDLEVTYPARIGDYSIYGSAELNTLTDTAFVSYIKGGVVFDALNDGSDVSTFVTPVILPNVWMHCSLVKDSYEYYDSSYNLSYSEFSIERFREITGDWSLLDQDIKNLEFTRNFNGSTEVYIVRFEIDGVYYRFQIDDIRQYQDVPRGKAKGIFAQEVNVSYKSSDVLDDVTFDTIYPYGRLEDQNLNDSRSRVTVDSQTGVQLFREEDLGFEFTRSFVNGISSVTRSTRLYLNLEETEFEDITQYEYKIFMNREHDARLKVVEDIPDEYKRFILSRDGNFERTEPIDEDDLPVNIRIEGGDAELFYVRPNRDTEDTNFTENQEAYYIFKDGNSYELLNPGFDIDSNIRYVF